MRLDAVLDSVYILSSLWGMPTGPQVCPARVSAMPGARYEREPSSVPSERRAVTAFVGVNVVPLDTERVLADQTVVVQDGRIVALGPSVTVKVPAGAVRIDGRGKYLMPGLVDMHVHNDYGSVDYPKLASSLPIFLADGVTAIRYLNDVAGDPQAFEAPGVVSPRVYTRGLVTYSAWGGMAATDTARGAGNPGEVRSRQNPKETLAPAAVGARVTAAKAAGYDFIRVHPSEVAGRATLPAVDSLLAGVRRSGLRVATHSHEKSFAQTLSLGAYGGSSDHLLSFWDTLGLSSSYMTKDTLGSAEVKAVLPRIQTFAAAAKRSGVWITPTLSCIEDGYLPSREKVMVLRQIVQALQTAGVGLFLAGDDGKNVHDELAALVQAGLTPYQALLTGTRNPAEYFGLRNEHGTVAVGKRADLVMLDGNPLVDVRQAREPAGVMIGGRWLDRAALDRDLLNLPMGKSWLRFWLRQGGVIPGLGRILAPGGVDPIPLQAPQREARLQAFEQLMDSLALVAATGRAGESARLRQRQADELGAIRAGISPHRSVIFDARVRAWMREQARQGYQVTVPGVTPTP